jgi:DNA-binding CsgD family transcriptional regulator
VLFASFFAGPVAIKYAVSSPERVSHLILWHSFATASDYAESSQQGAFMALLEQDWELFTETLAHARRGWSAGEPSRSWAALIRKSVTAEAFRAAIETFRSYDVSDLLGEVQAPTLVLQRRDFLPTSGIVEEKSVLEIPKALASGIPDGRLVLIDGDTGTPAAGDVEPVVRAIDEFLGLEYEVVTVRPREDVSAVGTGLGKLTAREREVLRLVAIGDSNKEIAAELKISVHTVERHLANIYGKIAVRGRAEAAAWAVKQGLA